MMMNSRQFVTAFILVLVSVASQVAAGPTLSRVNGRPHHHRGDVELGADMAMTSDVTQLGEVRPVGGHRRQCIGRIPHGPSHRHHTCRKCGGPPRPCTFDFSKLDIHAESDAKCTAKDGPSTSAGMALAMLSVLSGRPRDNESGVGANGAAGRSARPHGRD